MATITRTIGKIWDEICDKSRTANHIDSVIRYKMAIRNGMIPWNKVQ